MIKNKLLGIVMAAAVLSALVGCSKKEEAPATGGEQAAPKATSTPIDKSTVGSVSGTVKFDGAKPKPIKIDMSQDPACAKKGENTVETLMGDDGNLANVFVYVKSGVGDRTFDAP